MNEPQHTWQASNNNSYTYTIKDSSYLPDDDSLTGNYIFARWHEAEKRWVPIYIGQGELLARLKDEDHLPCVKDKGFTHIHVNLNGKRELARLVEEDEILEANPEAYIENGGCNVKEGG